MQAAVGSKKFVGNPKMVQPLVDGSNLRSGGLNIQAKCTSVSVFYFFEEIPFSPKWTEENKEKKRTRSVSGGGSGF